MRKIFALSLLVLFASCISTKNTIQNIDDTAILPKIVYGQFVLTETSNDSEYGYSEFYPVNLGFSKFENSNNSNVNRFFNSITGPNGEKITYRLLETCCPFPSKNNKMGAGTLDLYEIYLNEKASNKKIYINTFEKGKVMCPKGFSIKKV
ncbi:MAG: 2-dehydro-3-deoxyphosphooctonate aldolase [Flavobacteria bacterium RIFCSPLOWO2_12_FULL_31_7]|nr:MAG: 2-dehydro-3-deoxyphosphooctonate aldolase [Flavobacteria bacterium RIFCSPLOWO2_12_FULL_31_7]